MRIAILAHNLGAGGGLYGTVNTLKALNKVSVNEQFLVIYPKGCGYEEITLPEGSKVYAYSGSRSPLLLAWFEAVLLPKIVGRFQPDVVCGLGNMGLNGPGVQQAIFIHTPYPLYDDSEYPKLPFKTKLRAIALKRRLCKSAANADLIFCQTPIVKKRFAERFSYPADRIRIIRWPAPAEITIPNNSEPPPALGKSGVDFYVFIMTRYLAYRNPSILIPLCSKYASEFRRLQIKFITNLDPDQNKQTALFLKEVYDRNLDDIVINVGVLPREDVATYLWYSNVLWMPTFMETLCLPFLEAMVLGVPILAPDLDFARYVCGEAAVFYDPWDIDSAFTKIMLLRQDVSLRKTLVEKGRAELSNRDKFSKNWEEVADDILRGLKQLAIQ